MNRRTFLKQSLLTTGAMFVPAAGGLACVTVPTAAWTVARWFGLFVLELALEDAYDSIRDFMRDQNQQRAGQIEAVNQDMGAAGFTNGNNRHVYQVGEFSTYELGHEDQFNGCVVVFDGNLTPKAMVEGPTVMGLSAAAQDLKQKGMSSKEAQLALFPVEEGRRPTQNAFSYSYDRKLELGTRGGSLLIDYANLGSSKGQVGIQVKNRAGHAWFAGAYNISF